MEVAEDVDQIMAFFKQTEPTNEKTNEEKKENSNENGKEKGKSEDLISTQQKGGRGRRGRKKKIKTPLTKTVTPEKEVNSKPSKEKSDQVVEKTQGPENIINDKELQSENVNVPVDVQPQQPTKVRFGKVLFGD